MFQSHRPVYLDGEMTGFITARRAASKNGNTCWDAFMFAMHKAMRVAGLPSVFSRGLVGALDEMQNNIPDHSRAIDTGLIAYRASLERVEWVVADRGIGIVAEIAVRRFPVAA